MNWFLNLQNIKLSLLSVQWRSPRNKKLLCDLFAFLCPKLSQMAALLQCDVISFTGAEHVVLFTSNTTMLLALFHLNIEENSRNLFPSIIFRRRNVYHFVTIKNPLIWLHKGKNASYCLQIDKNFANWSARKNMGKPIFLNWQLIADCHEGPSNYFFIKERTLLWVIITCWIMDCRCQIRPS